MSSESGFSISIVQPSIPHYRLNFFARLGLRFFGRLHIYHSPPQGETAASFEHEWSVPVGEIRKLGPFKWQPNLMNIRFSRGCILVVPGDLHYISMLFLMVKARFGGAVVVAWGHFRSPYQSHFNQFLKELFWRSVDAVLFYTRSESILYSQRPYANKSVFYLNNGLDYSQIALHSIPYDPYRRGLEILFIGRVTRKARFDLLIEALDRLADKNIFLNVIGNTEEDLMSFEKSDSKRLKRIKFYGVMLDEADISRVMNRSVLFVYPGSVGLSIIHAISYGLPCVIHGNRDNHMPESDVFFDNEIGIPFDEGSSRSLALAVEAALSDRKLLARFSGNALHLARNVYNTSEMARNFTKMAEKLSFV
jgi:glycosyltransferase involved in cell wall biosynthesis